MKNKLMTGVWRYLIGVPPALWEREIQRHRGEVHQRLAFMTPEHRRVHHCAVRELPRLGKPLPPELIARELNLDPELITRILDDLEKNLTFIYRNQAGQVVWAYPVTVEKTPHRITFDSGETLYAA